jgi:UDP-N-acetylmuramoylalanine--D-glutamate ligase
MNKIAVLGAGSSGLAASRLAKKKGFTHVVIFDEASEEKLSGVLKVIKEEGLEAVVGEAAKNLKVNPGDFDLVIISPGLDVNWELPKKFTQAGVKLIGEMEFAFQYNKAVLIAITGTNGKSTCTEMIAHLLNHSGMPSIPCGNHGISLSEVILSEVGYTHLALEVSSFQLETIEQFHAPIMIWLNFAADHLDRYPDMESYFAAKQRIFLNATAQDLAIVRSAESVDSGAAKRLTFSSQEETGEFFYQDQWIYHQSGWKKNVADLRVRGKHNMENVMACLGVAIGLNLNLDLAFETLKSYQVPKHRCELVHEKNGIEYINDSKATNLHALQACICSLERPLILIAGGKNKGLDYHPLRKEIANYVKAMICIGEIQQELKNTFEDLLPCEVAENMQQAVEKATTYAQKGDLVVLSPGTSSFDRYRGYAQRGEDFAQCAKNI